ncbi:MAG: N-acetyltransferase family protein [Clostridia bacterium]
MEIRRATIEDASHILRLQQEIIETTDFFAHAPTDDQPTLAMQQQRIKETEENGGITLVAETDRDVVGFLFLARSPKLRFRHVGTLGIGISNAYTGKGLGTRMMTHAIQWAQEQEGLEKICLGVFSHNERAIHTYKKLGFVEEGRQIRQLKLENGKYVDDVYMALFLNVPSV